MVTINAIDSLANDEEPAIGEMSAFGVDVLDRQESMNARLEPFDDLLKPLGNRQHSERLIDVGNRL